MSDFEAQVREELGRMLSQTTGELNRFFPKSNLTARHFNEMKKSDWATEIELLRGKYTEKDIQDFLYQQMLREEGNA